MSFAPTVLVELIEAVADAVAKNADEITALDQAIGDGDHVTNMERGLAALMAQRAEIAQLEWPAAWQKIGMVMMTTVGGASGSLYGTLFVAMSKAAADKALSCVSFAAVLLNAVEAVKKRGKSDVGEKTMLDVLVPVANYWCDAAATQPLPVLLEQTKQVAQTGMLSTRDLLATKGRASFLGERTRGYIDAGAMSSCVMICALVDVLLTHLTAPAQ